MRTKTNSLWGGVGFLSAIALFLTMLCSSPAISSAQSVEIRPISGIVLDEEGAPAPGVAVMVKNTDNGTLTDTDGKFHLRVEFKKGEPTPVIVFSTMSIGMVIMGAAGLSFLGLGVQPPTPEWGAMLVAGTKYLQNYPHMVMFPGAMIAITVLAANMFGDGLRDAMDPKLKN